MTDHVMTSPGKILCKYFLKKKVEDFYFPILFQFVFFNTTSLYIFLNT